MTNSPHNLPAVLVITGLPGSGKSFVAKKFEIEGAVRFDADLFAREALDSLPVKDFLPSDCLRTDGSVDRRRLRDYFLADATLRHSLEQAIHPQVREMFENALAIVPVDKVVVYELPLLFEKNITHRAFVRTLCTVAPTEMIHARLRERGLEEESINRLLALHLTQERKAELSDFQLDTSVGEVEVVSAVQKIFKTIGK